jgi:DNA-binding transcriptional regulator LsrR (DeoR family)
VELDRLRHPKAGVLVCVGPDRVPAAVAALRGGYATHVVTSQASAEAMLA